MKIRLSLSKDRFVVSEDLTLHVALTNESEEAVAVPDPFHADSWQPVYTLVGPEYPQSRTFSFRSAISGDKRLAPTDGEPSKLVTLAPGETHEGNVPLHQWLQLEQPGRYEIYAHLRWDGTEAVSEPIAFMLEPLRLSSVAVGANLGAQEVGILYVPFLHSYDGQSHLLEAHFQESRPGLGFMERMGVSHVATVDAEARDVLSPWSGHNRRDGYHHWWAWRTGKGVNALSILDKAPQYLELDDESVIRPAVMTPRGELDIFALDDEGSLLAMVRFHPPQFDEEELVAPRPPQVLWREELPVRIKASQAVVLPESGEMSRRSLIAFTAQQEETVALGRAIVEDSQLVDLQVDYLPDAYLLPDARPGVHFEEDGSVRMAALLVRGEDHNELLIAEAGPDGLEIRPLLQLPARPQGGAAAYALAPEEARRLEWMVLLEDEHRDAVISSISSGRVHHLDPAPVRPLVLLPLSQATYLLVADDEQGLQFRALE